MNRDEQASSKTFVKLLRKEEIIFEEMDKVHRDTPLPTYLTLTLLTKL